MKLRLSALVFIGIVPLFSQDQPVRCISPASRFTISATGQDGQTSTRPINLQGDNVGTQHPAVLVADSKTVVEAVVMLKGHVEIRTSSFILKADAAEYHVCTGEIVARGNIDVRPIPTE